MSATIIQFVPRPNPKADRTYWIAPAEAFFEMQIASMAILGEIVDRALSDTAPAEYISPEKDPA